MGDATLVADLIIAMIEGIQSKKQIKPMYAKYEKEFNYNIEDLEFKFNKTIELIKSLFDDGLKHTPFKRIHLFYTLFTSIYHTEFNLKNITAQQKEIDLNKYGRVKNTLTNLNELFGTVPFQNISVEQIQFLEDSRRATTDTKVRVRRSEFIINIINSI
ncbi:MAG: hypothetical protein ACJA1B_002746 [Polaribacter sp.]|jgi:hypothetical protein